jgi:hypothetical protein
MKAWGIPPWVGDEQDPSAINELVAFEGAVMFLKARDERIAASRAASRG